MPRGTARDWALPQVRGSKYRAWECEGPGRATRRGPRATSRSWVASADLWHENRGSSPTTGRDRVLPAPLGPGRGLAKPPVGDAAAGT